MQTPNHSNRLAPEFQVEGAIVYSAELLRPSGPKTIRHSRSFVVARKGPRWNIRTMNLMQDDVVTGVEFDEAGCDGTQIDEVKSFDEHNPVIADGKARTTAHGRVRNAIEPAGFDLDLIHPLWIAYCSSHHSLSRQDDRIVAPLFNLADSFLDSPPPKLALPAKWKLNASSFIEGILWQSEGKELGLEPDGAFKLHELPSPFNSGFLRASFETTGWVEYNGMQLPGAFVMKTFFPNQSTGKLEVSYGVEAKVQTVHQTQDFSSVPKLSKTTRITDTRYRLGNGSGPHPTYAGLIWMTDEEIEAKCRGLGMDYEKQTPQN